MIEHIGEYEEFAQAMNRAGIAVIGHDHPGHGRTANQGNWAPMDEENGVRRVNGARWRRWHVARNTSFRAFRIFFWGTAWFVFGRRFITHYGEWLDGAISWELKPAGTTL